MLLQVSPQLLLHSGNQLQAISCQKLHTPLALQKEVCKKAKALHRHFKFSNIYAILGSKETTKERKKKLLRKMIFSSLVYNEKYKRKSNIIKIN